MMNLQKEIVYIDYIENGEKLKNAGHIKLWIRDNSCVLDLHMKGLFPTDTMMAEMRGIGREALLGRICIDKGAAYFNGSFPVDDMDGEGNGFYDLDGISIRLSESRVLEARWKEGAERATEMQPSTLKAASGSVENTVTNTVLQFPFRKEKEKILIQPAAEQNLPKVGQTENSDKKVTKYDDKNPDTENPDTEKQNQADQKDLLFPDKWVQLCHTYPIVHPFTTQDYLKIEPKDFTIMCKEYQQLVNNSFLLHGFYNYRHLILGKELIKNREVFYLGVPGTYYEREKMVAVMFGFESFEVSEQEFSQGFIPEGTFGYYLRTVEL